MSKIFFVEHFVTDKPGWDVKLGEKFAKIADEDVTIDKFLQAPEFKVNHPLLKVTDETGMFSCCLWKCPDHTTKGDFQEFIDDFCEGTSTNKVYEVEGSIGMQNLDERNFFRDMILFLQGKDRAGFLDKPVMRMVHHHINDKEGWEKLMMQGMATAARKCTTPSDAMKLFKNGHGTGMVLFLGDSDSMCFDGSGAGVTEEEFHEYMDEFIQGTCSKNVCYTVDQKNSCNIMQLSEDAWCTEFLKWGNEYSSPLSKTAAHETNPVEGPGIHLTSQ